MKKEVLTILNNLNLSDNLNCIRTKEEIAEKISIIISDMDNFTYDNYGSESADNGDYQIFYSEYSAEKTICDFVKWLFNENN